jgi:hypothetical protein
MSKLSDSRGEMSAVKEYGSYLLPVKSRFLLRSGQQSREEELARLWFRLRKVMFCAIGAFLVYHLSRKRSGIGYRWFGNLAAKMGMSVVTR